MSRPSRAVLVVDDDRDIRETLVELLIGEGYDAVGAEHGRDALDEIKRRPTGWLVLLDLMMPVMNGFEFMAALGADPALRDVAIIVISAQHSALLPVNAHAFLPKPIRLDDLLATVRRLNPAAPASV